jgi:hypothetical protein
LQFLVFLSGVLLLQAKNDVSGYQIRPSHSNIFRQYFRHIGYQHNSLKRPRVNTNNPADFLLLQWYCSTTPWLWLPSFVLPEFHSGLLMLNHFVVHWYRLPQRMSISRYQMYFKGGGFKLKLLRLLQVIFNHSVVVVILICFPPNCFRGLFMLNDFVVHCIPCPYRFQSTDTNQMY